MVRIKGVESQLIIADNYGELNKAIDRRLAELDGFSPELVVISNTKALIYHEEIQEEEEHAGVGRYCCECGNYEWGKKCLCGVKGHIDLMRPACEHFSVTLTVKGGVN